MGGQVIRPVRIPPHAYSLLLSPPCLYTYAYHRGCGNGKGGERLVLVYSKMNKVNKLDRNKKK